MINTETLQQELEHERQLNKIDYTSEDTNLYRELIVNSAEKIENGTMVNFEQHTKLHTV